MSQPVLTIRNLTLEFTTAHAPRRVLNDVNLTLRAGEIFGLAGESGSGKSTLAYSIMNYLPDSANIAAGQIQFDGCDLLRLSEGDMREIRGNRISMVYQDPKSALDPSMKVGDQIAEVFKIHGKLPVEGARKRTLELLKLVAIADPEDVSQRFPHQLSGGMQQRIVIAMALAGDPEILIMDEPTTGLDVTTQARIIDLILDIKTKIKAAILFITHDLGLLAEISDRVGIIYAGEMVEIGNKKDLFGQPAHPYTQGLLAAVPAIDRVHRPRPIPGRLPDLTLQAAGCIFAPRCTFATGKCKTLRPDIDTVSQGHQTRCHHWREVVENDWRVASAGSDIKSIKVASTDRPLFTVESLRKHFSTRGVLARLFRWADRSVKAVDDITLTVNQGEVLAVVGESGSGKSTLGQCIIGLLRATSGEVTYRTWKRDGGRTVTDAREFRTLTQMVFQHPHSSLNPMKRVGDILDRPLIVQGMPRAKRRERVDTLLNWVRLDPAYRTRFPSELSGGEKQRVAIARSVALQPEFVLLDEPVSALDVSVQAAVMELLSQLKNDIGCAYMFISHDLALVRSFSDRVAVMYLGKICEVGTVESVFQPPYHPYTRALLSAVPSPDLNAVKSKIHLDGALPSQQNPPAGCRFHTRCPSKLGNVCEHSPPPLRSNENGHVIACHIPLDELRQQPAVWQSQK